MTRDRLGSLKALSGGTDADDASRSKASNASANDGMEDFLSAVEDTRVKIDSIAANVERVKKLHADQLSTTQVAPGAVDDVMAEIRKATVSVNGTLRAMGVDADKASESQHKRIRQTQHAALTRKFAEVMSDYNAELAAHRDRCKARMKRQLQIVGRTVDTDEEMDRLLDPESGDAAKLFAGVAMDTQQARAAMELHDDLLKLEKSIVELHDMFTQVAILIQDQGDTIDNIEQNVISALEFAESGRVATQDAESNQQKARKKKIIIFVVLIIIALVLALIIYLSL